MFLSFLFVYICHAAVVKVDASKPIAIKTVPMKTTILKPKRSTARPKFQNNQKTNKQT